MFKTFAVAELRLAQFAASSSPRVPASVCVKFKRHLLERPSLGIVRYCSRRLQKLVIPSLVVFVSGVVAASTPCTEAGFQAILDGMISTGGQYLEVFPVNVPQFPTAFTEAEQKLSPAVSEVPDAPINLTVLPATATAAQVVPRSTTTAPLSNTFKGIYVVGGNLKTPQSILPAAIYATPYIDGVIVGGLWNQIEPSPGVYDWSIVDQEITRAVASNKKIAINVTAGAYAPSWLYAAPYNVPHDTFLWGNHDGANGSCDPYVLPAPWDPQYEQAWASMMSAYAQHLQSIPGAYAATTRVRLTGINTLTDELHLAFCSTSNGLALWQGLGYTPDKLLAAAKVLMSATNAAFPDKILSLSVIEAGGLPLINDAGQVVTTRDPSYIDVKQMLIDYALSPASGISKRFAVQWNGFQNPSTAARSVIAAGQKGAIVGWETNEFGGLTNGAECQ
jgi:hypothetical protein